MDELKLGYATGNFLPDLLVTYLPILSSSQCSGCSFTVLFVWAKSVLPQALVEERSTLAFATKPVVGPCLRTLRYPAHSCKSSRIPCAFEIDEDFGIAMLVLPL